MQQQVSATDYDRALAFLIDRIDYERSMAASYDTREFKLDRMRELLRRLGHPERKMPIVHIAGTKGKGSTAAMIAAMLTAAGYRTGLYTSPHLHALEERIAIDGQQCSRAEMVSLAERLRAVVEVMDAEASKQPNASGPTYFELTTAMALVSFADHRVQAAVLEVGMGGRLDSTNVCLSKVSVITSISLDHTRQLGDTLGAIAYEKAGIVKPGVPLVSGVTEDEPRQVIESVCRQRNSRLIQLGQDFAYRYSPPQRLDLQASGGTLDFSWRADERAFSRMELGLLGPHQAANAAVALATILELQAQGWQVGESELRRGLAEVRWPARVEVVARRPTIVLDAAHNVASVAALLATLGESFSARRRVLVFATTRDKDVRGMLSLALPRFDTVLLTRYRHNPRYLPVEELAAIAAELGGDHCGICEDAAAAWDQARRTLEQDDLLCVSGSFFIAAEMRQEIAARPLENRAPPVGMAE